MDDTSWQKCNSLDSTMLEREFVKQGPTASFSTTDFSFNQEHNTLYRIDFVSMMQVVTRAHAHVRGLCNV